MGKSKHWIKGALKRPGAFRAKARRAGLSPGAYASQVLAQGAQADTRTKRQAALAQTLRKFNRKR